MRLMFSMALCVASGAGMVDSFCDSLAGNCSGCSCYKEARSCNAAGCHFGHKGCAAVAAPKPCPLLLQGGMPYVCRANMDATKNTLKLCNQQRLHPFSSSMFGGAADFAETMAEYVRHTLNRSAAEYPLRFAYYTNWMTDSRVECRDAGQGPYQVHGGGEPLCHMLEWNAGLSKKRLAKYLVGLMTASNESALAKSFDSVKDFGYESMKDLCESVAKGWPGTVYDPSGNHSTLDELQHQQELGRPYWGITGGAGAGAGFGISCVGPSGEEPIITGGGGGGGGMSSPGVPAIQAGGGGGGVSVGFDGPAAGAGAGGGGVALDMEQTDPQYWLLSMQLVAQQIRHCAQTPNKQLVLRGGGGGGGSFTAQMPAVELPPALTFGYGFEFSLAREHAPPLASRHVFGDAAFVSCPGSMDYSCRGCVDEDDEAAATRRLVEEKGTQVVEGVGALFACSSRWASNICKRASFNGTSYGEWQHYESCVCPVSHLFLAKHLPNTSEFKWITKGKHGPHCFPATSGQTRLPSITRQMISANCEAWCEHPRVHLDHACPLLPGCDCLKPSQLHAEIPSSKQVTGFLSAVSFSTFGMLTLGVILGALITQFLHLVLRQKRQVMVSELGEMLKP